MKKIAIISVVVLLAAAGAYLLFGRTAPKDTTPVGQYTRVVTVTRGNLNLVVSANGTVQPINKVEIKSKASGQIEDLKFIEGQNVTKGELLLALDQRTTKNDLDQSKADLEVAQANLKQQQNAVNRAKELFGKQLMSQQELDQATVDYVRAQASLVKSQAALSSAEERLRDTRIVAPITGVILTKNIELGQIISSGVSTVGGGTLLATVADMNEVYVETNVDEVDIGKVQPGQRATVIADAYPDDRFTGAVERISPLGKTSSNVTTFSVIILVRNLGGKLKAGMSASVDIEIFSQQNVLLVPNDALKDPRSAQGRQVMEANNLTLPVDSSKPAVAAQGGENGQGQSMRERFQNMSEDERTKMREQFRQRMQNMSPEERQQMFQRFSGGGPGGGGGGEGGGFFRMRRQETPLNEVRYRIVSAKDGDRFVPKIIKIGPSNFDQTVVLDGLTEGQEIEVVTISRAKIAQEQMNERMRSMNSMGGMGGGGNAARSATGAGSGRR